MRNHAVFPLSLLAALVPFVSAGCASDSQVRSQAEETHAQLEPAVMKDAELAGYLQQIGARVAAAAQELDKEHVGPKEHFKEDNSWMFSTDEFHLVNSEQLNAFTTGGSHMYVYTQLMQTCRSEDELAAVVSHEFAHVYCRHVQKGMDRQMWALGGAAALGVAGYAAGGKQHGTEYAAYGVALGMVAGNFLGMGFTRDDEAQADEYGFQFYCRAGWDPNRFSGFFQTLIDKGLDKTPEAMSDHPKLSTRVANTDKRVAQLPADAAKWRRPPIADAQQFAALRQKSAQLAKAMPNDQAAQKAQAILAAFPSCVARSDQPGQSSARCQVRSDAINAFYVPK